MSKMRGIGRVRLVPPARARLAAIVAAVAGITLAMARPAHAATACGAMITNLAQAASWESLNGAQISGTNLVPSVIPTATAYVQVNGSTFTGWKDWTNITRGGKVPPLPGDVVQFAVTVSNTGTVPMAGMAIIDTAPAGVTVVTTPGTATIFVNAVPVSNTSWDVSYAAGTFTADQVGGTWGKGDTAIFRYNVLVNSVCANTNITNTAWIGASDACIPAILSATSFVAVPAVVTTAITKVHNPASVVSGGAFKFYIVVTNTGQATITTLRIVDTLAAQVTYVSDTSSAGLGHSFVGQRQAWDGILAVPLAPGMSASVVISASADSCYQGVVSNTAWVAAFDACGNKNLGGSSYIDSFTLTPQGVGI